MRMKKMILMTDDKKDRLEQSGFRVGSIAEFLDLTPEAAEKNALKNFSSVSSMISASSSASKIAFK